MYFNKQFEQIIHQMNRNIASPVQPTVSRFQEATYPLRIGHSSSFSQLHFTYSNAKKDLANVYESNKKLERGINKSRERLIRGIDMYSSQIKNSSISVPADNHQNLAGKVGGSILNISYEKKMKQVEDISIQNTELLKKNQILISQIKQKTIRIDKLEQIIYSLKKQLSASKIDSVCLKCSQLERKLRQFGDLQQKVKQFQQNFINLNHYIEELETQKSALKKRMNQKTEQMIINREQIHILRESHIKQRQQADKENNELRQKIRKKEIQIQNLEKQIILGKQNERRNVQQETQLLRQKYEKQIEFLHRQAEQKEKNTQQIRNMMNQLRNSKQQQMMIGKKEMKQMEDQMHRWKNQCETSYSNLMKAESYIQQLIITVEQLKVSHNHSVQQRNTQEKLIQQLQTEINTLNTKFTEETARQRTQFLQKLNQEKIKVSQAQAQIRNIMHKNQQIYTKIKYYQQNMEDIQKQVQFQMEIRLKQNLQLQAQIQKIRRQNREKQQPQLHTNTIIEGLHKQIEIKGIQLQKFRKEKEQLYQNLVNAENYIEECHEKILNTNKDINQKDLLIDELKSQLESEAQIKNRLNNILVQKEIQFSHQIAKQNDLMLKIKLFQAEMKEMRNLLEVQNSQKQIKYDQLVKAKDYIEECLLKIRQMEQKIEQSTNISEEQNSVNQITIKELQEINSLLKNSIQKEEEKRKIWQSQLLVKMRQLEQRNMHLQSQHIRISNDNEGLKIRHNQAMSKIEGLQKTFEEAVVETCRQAEKRFLQEQTRIKEHYQIILKQLEQVKQSQPTDINPRKSEENKKYQSNIAFHSHIGLENHHSGLLDDLNEKLIEIQRQKKSAFLQLQKLQSYRQTEEKLKFAEEKIIELEKQIQNLHIENQNYQGTMSLQTGYRSTISNDQYQMKISALQSQLDNLTTHCNIQKQEIMLKNQKLAQLTQEISQLSQRDKEIKILGGYIADQGQLQSSRNEGQFLQDEELLNLKKIIRQLQIRNEDLIKNNIQQQQQIKRMGNIQSALLYAEEYIRKLEAESIQTNFHQRNSNTGEPSNEEIIHKLEEALLMNSVKDNEIRNYEQELTRRNQKYVRLQAQMNNLQNHCRMLEAELSKSKGKVNLESVTTNIQNSKINQPKIIGNFEENVEDLIIEIGSIKNKFYQIPTMLSDSIEFSLIELLKPAQTETQLLGVFEEIFRNLSETERIYVSNLQQRQIFLQVDSMAQNWTQYSNSHQYKTFLEDQRYELTRNNQKMGEEIDSQKKKSRNYQ